MIKQSKNISVYTAIFIALISFTIGCGSDDDTPTLSNNYLPIQVGNSWTFVDSEYPEDSSDTISITGTTKLPDGKTVFIAAATDQDGSDDSGYLSRAANDLVLFHKTLTDFQGGLIYSPPIKVGAKWQDEQGQAVVIAQETVSTPAGVFQNCFRINVTLEDYSYNYVVWLARNVGPVKIAETYWDYEIRAASVLKSYNIR